MSNGIATRQNEDNSIAMLAAQRQLYRDAKKINTVSVAVSVWIPFALAVVLLIIPGNAEWKCASYILSIVSMVLGFGIDKYIEEKKPLDKAGAYGIQEMGKKFIKKVDGDMENVIGLPTKTLKEILEEFDYKFN